LLQKQKEAIVDLDNERCEHNRERASLSEQLKQALARLEDVQAAKDKASVFFVFLCKKKKKYNTNSECVWSDFRRSQQGSYRSQAHFGGEKAAGSIRCTSGRATADGQRKGVFFFFLTVRLF